MFLVRFVTMLHDLFFRMVDRLLGDTFLGLFARFVFAAVLAVYFWSSALTKVGPGPLGFVFLAPGAYAQMFPPVFEAASYDPGAVALHWKMLAVAATWAEIILPALIILGLFTRAAALGMIAFVAVQSYVDWAFHGADAETLGRWFDRTSGSAILDQRALWMFLLAYLFVRGAGAISLDRLVAGRSAR